MKILSWNLQRPNKDINSSKNQFILETINALDPDVIFLTETNTAINFKYYFKLESAKLPNFHENQKYLEGENRITIFSKYPLISQIKTYDNYTAVCGEISTELGDLMLYGSVIGSFGGKDKFFESDFVHQKEEIKNCTKNICISGDFNISFSGFPYPSRKIISETEQFFQENNLINLTKDNRDCALHIVLTKDFIKDRTCKTQMIIIDRKISDHNVVLVEIL